MNITITFNKYDAINDMIDDAIDDAMTIIETHRNVFVTGEMRDDSTLYVRNDGEINVRGDVVYDVRDENGIGGACDVYDVRVHIREHVRALYK